MADQREKDLGELALQFMLTALFQSLEDVTIRIAACREVVAQVKGEKEMDDLIRQAEASLRAQRVPERYSDLLRRALELVQAHSLSELAGLAPEVRERVRIWGTK